MPNSAMDSSEGINGAPSDVVTEDDIVNVEDLAECQNDVPAQIEKHLEFIASNRDGHILLGSSNLAGRYWSGSVWYYVDPFLAPDVESSMAAIEFPNGVTDCVFVDDRRAIVAQDAGLIDYVTIKDWNGRLVIERSRQIDDHGYAVICVKLACDATTAITASRDMGIRLWDTSTTACKRNITPAHTQEVTSVAPHPRHPEVFLSSSLDGNVLLWDIRVPRPAACVFRDVDDCPSAVTWVPSAECDPAGYLVGTLSGAVHLRTPKVISYSACVVQPFRRAVYRFAPNKYRCNQIAACADETRVRVLTIDEGDVTTSYCDDRHEDFVRGLEWLNETCLVSCGWDKAVLRHTADSQEPSHAAANST